MSVGEPQFGGNKARWSLTNNGGSPATINSIFLSWPETNRKLKKVKLGKDTIFDQKRDPTSTTIDSDWKGGADKRTIEPGETKVLRFEFEQKHISDNPNDYTLEIGFQ